MSAGVSSFAYGGSKPWWDAAGTDVSGAQNWHDAALMAGFDETFKLGQAWVEDVDENGDGELIEAPGNYGVVRNSDGKFMAMVGSKYEILQPLQQFQFLEDLTDIGADLQFSTAGSIGGSRFWVMAKLGDQFEPLKNDPVQEYLCFMSSVDGSLASLIGWTAVRIVCWNTFMAAMRGLHNEHLMKRKHTKNQQQDIELAKKAIAQRLKMSAVFHEEAAALGRRQVTDQEVEDFVKTIFPAKGKKVPTQTLNKRHAVIRNFAYGTGSDLAEGSAWQLFNAVTEFTNHQQKTTNLEKRFSSVMTGTSSNLNLQAYQYVTALL